jgi:hypothetical protein
MESMDSLEKEAKVMKQSLSFTPRSSLTRHALSLHTLILTVMLWMTSAWYGFAQFEQDDFTKLKKQIAAGLNPHEVALAAFSKEWRVKNEAAEQQKVTFITQVAELAGTLLATCDTTVHGSLEITRHPPFDWSKYGLKPPFGRENPDAIAHPEAREAYRKVLAAHDALALRVVAEREKLTEADYCLGVVRRVVCSSKDQEKTRAALLKYVDSNTSDEWAKKYILSGLAPRPEDSLPDGNFLKTTLPEIAPVPLSVSQTSNDRPGHTSQAVTSRTTVTDSSHSAAYSKKTWLLAGGIFLTVCSVVAFYIHRRRSRNRS